MKLTDLTSDELQALFALSVPTALSDLGMESEARGALLKLAASLPAARRAVERDVRSRIYLDPDPWRSSRESIPTLATLRQAVWEDRWVAAVFLRAKLIQVEHEIAPYGLVAKGKSWYVVWSGRNGDVRVDNAASVIGAVLIDESFRRAPAFDLARFWTSWAASHEASRPVLEVHLRVRADVVGSLKRTIRPPIEPIESANSSASRPWVKLIAGFDDFEQARALLLAYGGAVEVIEPESLRLSVEDYARQTLLIYRAPAAAMPAAE